MPGKDGKDGQRGPEGILLIANQLINFLLQTYFLGLPGATGQKGKSNDKFSFILDFKRNI